MKQAGGFERPACFFGTGGISGMTDLEFLKLSGPQKKLHKLGAFFASVPGRLLDGLKKLK